MALNELRNTFSLDHNNFAELAVNTMLSDVFHSGKSSSFDTQMYNTNDRWNDFIEEFKEDFQILQSYKSTGILVGSRIVVQYDKKPLNCTLKYYGEVDAIEVFKTRVEQYFDVIETTIEWMYSGDGYSIKLPLNIDNKPNIAMYPFMQESLDDYYQRYIDSSASILVLIGPPGVGKTTWIKGFLDFYKKNSIVTYDASILQKDYIFAEFLESDKMVMVLEDADNFLGTRADGNNMMHKFLNVGDGLVTVKGKKIIFSTNLPSIADIDSALIRPGRCFDVLHFKELNHEEMLKLCKSINVLAPTKVKASYSLGDIFHEQKQTKKTRNFGFI